MIFHITEAQTEAMIDSNGVADDFRREAVSAVTGSGAVHEISLSVGCSTPIFGKPLCCRSASVHNWPTKPQVANGQVISGSTSANERRLWTSTSSHSTLTAASAV